MGSEKMVQMPASVFRRSLPFLLLALIACIGILAAVPPVDRDALTHHLAVPKLYLQHGGMVEIPDVVFSYYPMNLELLYLLPLYFGDDILPKYIHFAFALLTAGLIYGYLKRRLASPFWGLFGAILFLSLPVVVKLSITAYVDLGLIFFSTAAFLQILSWAAGGFHMRRLVWAGICCGLCLGTKYNGMISLFLLTCLVSVLYLRDGAKPEAGAAPGRHARLRIEAAGMRATINALAFSTVFAATALAVFSPWMIRNTLWTGNPVYPLFQSVFRPKPSPPDALSAGEQAVSPSAGQESETGWSHFAIRKIMFNESLTETLAIPLRIFFQGQDDNPRLFDGRLNPYLFIFPWFAFWCPRTTGGAPARREARAFAAFAVLYLLYTFFETDMRVRYVGPMLPPLVILAVLGVQRLAAAVKNAVRPGVSVPAALCLSLAIVWMGAQNLTYLTDQFRKVDPLSYLSGRLDRAEYIQKYRPEYEVIQYANQHLPLDAKILGLFLGHRIYYSDRALVADDEYFKWALLHAASADTLTRELVRPGITHMLVQFEIFNTWARDFDPAAQKRLAAFVQHNLEPVYAGHGYGLFKLQEKGA
jgi:4-amino-4-deoxy-L-arabinose transferase-like glycosyltransferase